MAILPISVCMISGAEAHRIRRALESVSGWTAEQIIVLNDDVRDGTDELARSMGAKVFPEPWKGFREQKNSAAAKAAQDWLLNLDADEVVSPELQSEIQALFKNKSRLESAAAFSFPRLNWYCGRWIRHGDWYPDRVVRLWRRGRANWVGGDVHERLEVQGTVLKLSKHLYHFSRPNINAHLAKIIPFSDEFVRQHTTDLSRPSLRDFALRPWWRFVRAYFFRMGFLDGWPGYYIACHTAFSTLVRYAKLRERVEAAPASLGSPVPQARPVPPQSH